MENSVVAYIIWRANPEIFSLNGFTLRWSALLLILAFLVSRQILLSVFKKEGRPVHAVSYLCIYLAVVALAGARLGYLIFYEPRALFSKGLSVVLPFSFEPDFRLLPPDEFSLHGAVLATLIFLWFYSRKNPLKQHYFQLLDRIALVAALSGAFLFVSSFFSLSREGKPTDSFIGTVAISPVQRGLMRVPCCIMRSPDGKNPLERVAVRRDPVPPIDENSQKSLILYLFFKPGASERLVNEFLIGDVKTFLYEKPGFVYEPGDQPLHYRIFLERDGKYIARVQTMGIARYPVAVFEAAVCLAIFIFLWFHAEMKAAGKVFGLANILFWSFHSGFGFLTEGVSPIEIVLNILFILVGMTVLILSYRRSLASAGAATGAGEKILSGKD